MKESGEDILGRKVGAILCGIVTIVIAAGIMIPILQMVFDNFFELNFRSHSHGNTANSSIIILAVFLWGFLATMAGGFVSSIISLRKEYQNIWIIISIGWLLFLLYFTGEIKIENFPLVMAFMLFLIAGALTGCALGIRHKNKREQKKTNLNSQPFPPDTL